MLVPGCKEDDGDDGGAGDDGGTSDDGGTGTGDGGTGDGGTGDGGTGDGGTGDGGTGTGDGGDTGTVPPGCRRYLTAGTFTSPMFSGDMTGSFDDETFTYEGTVSSDMGDIVTAREYASLEDFVEEVAAMGRFRMTRETTTADFVNMDTTFEYDADKQLTSKATDDLDPNGRDTTTTYTEWDSEGRPTVGALTVDGLDCTDMPVTIDYDEGTRTRKETTDSAGGAGDCGTDDPVEGWKVYDEDGIVIEETLGVDNEGQPQIGTTTITATEEICL
jgi:hypothetical protein